MLNVAPAPAISSSSFTKGRTASGTSAAAAGGPALLGSGASTASSTAASSSVESLSHQLARNPLPLPPLSPTRQRAATTGDRRERDETQLTKSELFELRERQLRNKREEVTWETSSYDRERGRMVRSLNVIERNRLLDTQRQLKREMEQRIRDIRQEQTAVLTVYTASKVMGRALSHQDLRLLMSTGNSRSHSGGTSRFC